MQDGRTMRDFSKMSLDYFIDYYAIKKILNHHELKTIEFTGKIIDIDSNKIEIKTKDKNEILQIFEKENIIFGESLIIINIVDGGIISFICKKEGLYCVFRTLSDY